MKHTLLLSLILFSPLFVYAETNNLQGIKGKWEGNLTVYADNGVFDPFEVEFVFFNCDGKIRIIFDGEEYDDHSSGESKNGNHIVYSIDGKGPKDWVETRYWGFIEHDGWANVSYNRMVSNPMLKQENKFWAFSQYGKGIMRKKSDTCESSANKSLKDAP